MRGASSSAVAARPYGYGYGYYDAPAYYAEPYAQPYAYEQPYAYGPVYPAPEYGAYGYSNRGCTTDEGYGRRRPCSGKWEACWAGPRPIRRSQPRRAAV